MHTKKEEKQETFTNKAKENFKYVYSFLLPNSCRYGLLNVLTDAENIF